MNSVFMVTLWNRTTMNNKNRLYLYSWLLQLITVKEYKAKSAEKSRKGQSPGETRHKLPAGLFRQVGAHRMRLCPPVVTTPVKCCRPGKLMRKSGPRVFFFFFFFFEGVGMFPDSRRKAGVQHKPDCLYSLGLVTTLIS